MEGTKKYLSRSAVRQPRLPGNDYSAKLLSKRSRILNQVIQENAWAGHLFEKLENYYTLRQSTNPHRFLKSRSSATTQKKRPHSNKKFGVLWPTPAVNLEPAKTPRDLIELPCQAAPPLSSLTPRQTGHDAPPAFAFLLPFEKLGKNPPGLSRPSPDRIASPGTRLPAMSRTQTSCKRRQTTGYHCLRRTPHPRKRMQATAQTTVRRVYAKCKYGARAQQAATLIQKHWRGHWTRKLVLGQLKIKAKADAAIRDLEQLKQEVEAEDLAVPVQFQQCWEFFNSKTATKFYSKKQLVC